MLDQAQESSGSKKSNLKVEPIPHNGKPAEVATTTDWTPAAQAAKAADAAITASATTDHYEEYKLMPESPWPPPIFVKKNISPQERYYLEHRWNSQWRFFDKKATENKQKYFRTQLIIGIGSVIVPALVSFNPTLASFLAQIIEPLTDSLARNLVDLLTVIVSLSVAIAAAVESLNKYGENWNTYRQAAEELQAEKSFYDVNAGRYANNPEGFARFVEQCESIIAKQNGRYLQAVERQNQETSARSREILDQYKDQDQDEVSGQTIAG